MVNLSEKLKLQIFLTINNFYWYLLDVLVSQPEWPSKVENFLLTLKLFLNNFNYYIIKINPNGSHCHLFS